MSGLAIYQTACYLVNDIAAEGLQQDQFRATLFDYLLLFSLIAVVIGSILHFYLTRKLIRPLRDLTQSTEKIKEGLYPEPIPIHRKDELGEFIAIFNQLVEQLKINEQQRQRMVSDLSHEFRTPLSNLNGYLGALKSGVIEGDPKLYQSLLNESKRVTKLVEQMEQLKQWDVESKHAVFEKEYINIAVLVEQSVEMFRWLLNEKDIGLEIQTDNQEVEVNINGISQVISNLMDNAIRYYKGKNPIIIQGESVDNEYKVSISGEGQYIPQQEQEKVFNRLHRIDHSRSRQLGGNGLGLAISREIIERHNGKIGLTSNGHYHTFWFTVPLKE